MKIKPLHDRVVVKRLDELTKTSGGIIIPDTAKEKPSEGIVEAVGDGARTELSWNRIKNPSEVVKVGDKVLFAKWGGTEVKLNGEDRVIMKESDILAVVEE